MESIFSEPTELVLLRDDGAEKRELAEELDEFVDVGERMSIKEAGRVGGREMSVSVRTVKKVI